MKKITMFLICALVGITSYSQADPAFTEKIVNVINTAKDYYLASEGDKPGKLELAYQAINAVRPITDAQLSSKLLAMQGSSEEMAKIPGPLGFALCILNAGSWYIGCMNGTSQSHPGAPFCNGGYQLAIIMCGTSNLMN